ncbi:MAG TPA: hypothetical protein VK894_07625 [Jiangellales bacterium]|nr:hypothetical protein [Jiangellales bacterium]
MQHLPTAPESGRGVTRGLDAAPGSDGRGVTRFLLVLLAVTLVLTVVSYLAMSRLDPQDLEPWAQDLRQYVNVGNELNLPAWWSTVLLSSAAMAHVLTGALARSTGHKGAGAWFVVAAAVALMSLDEQTALHERMEAVGRNLVTDVVSDHPFRWTAPGAVIGIALVVMFLLTARHLPRRAGRTLVAGVVLLLVSAVGLEVVGGRVLLDQGFEGLYTVLYHVEELGENLGALLLIAAAARAVDASRTPDGWLLAYRGVR